MTKRKPMQIWDERGRFVHASSEVRAGLEAMRPKADVVIRAEGFAELAAGLDRVRSNYCDEIYRPKKIGWLERALQWFTWNRSRA